MNSRDSVLRYQADERAPISDAIILGVQLTALSVATSIFITTIVYRAAGQSETYLLWAVVAAIATGGVTTILQSLRYRYIGTGYVLMMGGSSVYAAVCIPALAEGGPGTLVVLVAVAALFQLLISARLALFRRIFTSTVSGTVLMLIPISVLQPVYSMVRKVPEGSPVFSAEICALITVVVICIFSIRKFGRIRLWASLIGVALGSIAAAYFGIYDMTRVVESPWFGFPEFQWPVLDVSIGPVFWALAPGFLLAGMIGSLRTISSAVAGQNVSWRTPQAVDYRAVQRAVATDGFGNLLAGFAGTVPNSSYALGASFTRVTGIASRNVGIVAGIIFTSLAFFPKGLALVLAIPDPVFAAFLSVMLARLFIVGVQIVLRDEFNYRKGMIVGASLLVGFGFQFGFIFPQFFVELAYGLFNNAMTTGGFVAILLTVLMNLRRSRPKHLEIAFEVASLSQIREFLGKFSRSNGWDVNIKNRLDAIAEESLLTLLEQKGNNDKDGHLLVSARREGNGAILEFVAATLEIENLQDQIAMLGEPTDEALIGQKTSLRILDHYAASVRHQQYHGVDVITVRAETT